MKRQFIYLIGYGAGVRVISVVYEHSGLFNDSISAICVR